MNWFEKHSIQLAFIGSYLLLLAYHGWKGKKKSNSLGDFLVAGRSLSGAVVALSFYATFVSSVTFVGHAGRSFSRGPAWWLTCVVVFTSMVFLAWFVVAPPFVAQSSRFNALTIPDFLGKRYRSILLRRMSAIVVIAASLAYMVAVYVGAVKLLGSLLELDENFVLLIIFLVVTAYTLAGGFHAVVSTDAVQGLILFIGGLVLPAAMIVQKGGLAPLLAAVKTAEPTALDWSREMPLVTLIGLALGVGLKIIVEPRQLSRFNGLSSNEQLSRGKWLSPALLFLTYLCMLPVGFLAHAFVTRDELISAAGGSFSTDNVVPYLLGTANVLGPIAGSFFLTGMVAAAMSSLDSVLLVAASSVDYDLIAPGRNQNSAMKLTRIWLFILSFVAACLAWCSTNGIVEMSSFSGSMYAACFLPTLVIGLFWKQATKSGAIAAVLVGFSVTLFWFYAKRELADGAYSTWHEVYLGLAASIPTYFFISLLTRNETDEDETAAEIDAKVS